MSDEPRRRRSLRTTTRKLPLSASASRSTQANQSNSFQFTSPAGTAEPDMLNIILGGIVQDQNESVQNELPTVPTGKTEAILLKKLFDTKEKSSKRRLKIHRSDSQMYCHSSTGHEAYASNSPSMPIGAQRREELTRFMRSFYQDCFELDDHSTMNAANDHLLDNEKRKQYSIDLW